MSVRNESLPQFGSALLSIAGVVVLAGVALFLFSPPKTPGLGLRLLGAGLVVIGIVGMSIMLRVTPSLARGAVSFGEKTSWISLAATLIAATYLTYKIIDIASAGIYPDGTVGEEIARVILVLILGDIIVNRLRRQKGGTLIDERDGEVRRRAIGGSHEVLLGLLLVFAIAIDWAPMRNLLSMSTPAGIAHGVMLVLVLAELVRHATAIRIYRSDRT